VCQLFGEARAKLLERETQVLGNLLNILRGHIDILIPAMLMAAVSALLTFKIHVEMLSFRVSPVKRRTMCDNFAGMVASFWTPIPGKGDSLVPLAGDLTLNGFCEGRRIVPVVLCAGWRAASWGDKTVPPPRRVPSRWLKNGTRTALARISLVWSSAFRSCSQIKR
jgi:hypothetical protein